MDKYLINFQFKNGHSSVSEYETPVDMWKEIWLLGDKPTKYFTYHTKQSQSPNGYKVFRFAPGQTGTLLKFTRIFKEI